MIRDDKELDTEIVNCMRGGRGDVEIKKLLKPDEFHGKGRLFNKITLKPDTSIGLHKHVGDCETYYILSGVGLYNDNGNIVNVKAGQVLYTDSGEEHSIENNGESDLEFIAMILFA